MEGVEKRCPFCGWWGEDIQIRRRLTKYPTSVKTGNWMYSCLDCFTKDTLLCNQLCADRESITNG